MASDDLAFATIAEIAARYRRGALSPVELTRALLGRIERFDPTLHAFVTVTAERALADARRAEAALRREEDGNPLLGIPVAYKDIYATRGIRTTAGSAVLADWVPEDDATCVTRLQRAGCVMLGKLITHEFAFGLQFPGHRFQPARNPWNLEHMPGGSSSGSAAALAAGLAHGALGSDTGGSIRGPAAFCNIVGLKPTYGRVSRAGVITLSWTLDHAGPMARTVEDCPLVLQALAGYDSADAASSREPVADYLVPLGQGIRGLRVGVPRAYFFEGVDAEVEKAFEEALATLRDLGATVTDVEIPSIQTSWAFLAILMAEAFAYHERDVRGHPELYGDVLRGRPHPGLGVRPGSAAAFTPSGGDARRPEAHRRPRHAHDAEACADVRRGVGPELRVPEEQHGALQHDGAPRARGALRLLRAGASALPPDRRTAIRRVDGAAPRPCLRAGDRVARTAPEDLSEDDHGPPAALHERRRGDVHPARHSSLSARPDPDGGHPAHPRGRRQGAERGQPSDHALPGGDGPRAGPRVRQALPRGVVGQALGRAPLDEARGHPARGQELSCRGAARRGDAGCAVRRSGAGRPTGLRQLGHPRLPEPHARRARPGHRLGPGEAPRQSDGPPLRAPRDPQGRELPLLDPARLPPRELRREPAA